MDPRLMRKGVVADYRVVGRKPDHARPLDEFRCVLEHAEIYSRLYAIHRLQCGHGLFEARITRPLPQPINRDVHLGCPCLDPRERVCHRHAKVVVAVHRDRLLEPAAEHAYECLHSLGLHHAYGVRYVVHIGPMRLDAGVKLDEPLNRGTGGVLAGELALETMRLHVVRRLDCLLQRLSLVHPEFVFEVDVRSGNKYVCPVDVCLEARVYIAGYAPGKAAYLSAESQPLDHLYRVDLVF